MKSLSESLNENNINEVAGASVVAAYLTVGFFIYIIGLSTLVAGITGGVSVGLVKLLTTVPVVIKNRKAIKELSNYIEEHDLCPKEIKDNIDRSTGFEQLAEMVNKRRIKKENNDPVEACMDELKTWVELKPEEQRESLLSDLRTILAKFKFK